MIPFDKRDGKIWYNNELVEWQDAKLHVISHGLHYASLVFEGLRVYEGQIFKLEEHTDRLFQSASLVGMKMPFSKEELMQAQCDSVTKNNLKNAYSIKYYEKKIKN
jgi:branched-chain amino acid aminotransferase